MNAIVGCSFPGDVVKLRDNIETIDRFTETEWGTESFTTRRRSERWARTLVEH